MAQGAQPATGERTGLKAERDRFVALAFCWADVLLELDASAKVAFAAGPVRPLMGREASTLIGTPVAELVEAADRPLLDSLLRIAGRRGRIEGTAVRILGPGGAAMPMYIAGYRLDDLGGHYFVALRIKGAKAADREAKLARDETSGLFDAGSFADVVSRQVAERTGEADMTLIALGAFRELEARLDAKQALDLLGALGGLLKANSVDGDSAARIADDKYGLVHAKDVDVEALKDSIADLVREHDPQGKGVAVEVATVAVEETKAGDADVAKGIVYAINRFKNAEGQGFSIHQLTSNIDQLVASATETVANFKKIVAERAFEVALQPIIDVMTGEVHHYEALARFNALKSGESPYEYIAFAEETGLIEEFDLAMAGKSLEWLNRTPRNSKLSLAVNVSGNSVGSARYQDGLHALLTENLWARGRLIFEITESARLTDLNAANAVVQRLRTDGYPVCLDDFGAGAASFQYLSTMEVDVVKLDGSTVRNAQKAQKGKAFLRSLATLCKDLGVETIGEMVDDVAGLRFIRECGVQYVQGYLFGKPSHDIASFKEHRKSLLFPQWRGS